MRKSFGSIRGTLPVQQFELPPKPMLNRQSFPALRLRKVASSSTGEFLRCCVCHACGTRGPRSSTRTRSFGRVARKDFRKKDVAKPLPIATTSNRSSPAMTSVLGRLFLGLHVVPERVHLVERGLLRRFAALTQQRLDTAEATFELQGRAAQGRLGVGAGEPADIDHGEQQIADLVVDALARRVLVGQLGAQLA